MTLTINILLLVLIISATCLCVFLIVYLKKYFKQIEAVCKDFNQLVANTIPILNNLEEVTSCTNRMITDVEEYWEKIDHSIKSLQKIVSIFGSWKLIRAVKWISSKLLNKRWAAISSLM